MQESESLVYKSPTLYARASNGKLLMWRAETYKNEDSTATTMLTSGYVDGTKKETVRTYTKGKHEGKKNSTSAVQQAINETKSRFNKQLDKGYRESTDELTTLPVRPMLAQPFVSNQDKVKSDDIYICQPKLDGVRCTVQRNGNILTFLSRTSKPYDILLKHKSLCEELLEVMPDGDIWDGEIYCHGTALQDIVSAVKCFTPATKRLEYWVYDIVSDKIQYERVSKYRALLADKKLKKVLPCPIDYVKGMVNIVNKQEEYLAQGFEGLMLRKYNAKYRQGYRSYDLLKYKNFTDTEYKITGFSNDVDNCIIFEFYNKGKPFSAVPCWTKAQRKEAYKQGCEKACTWIGKKATVRCSSFSKSGVPIGNPVVTTIRDYE